MNEALLLKNLDTLQATQPLLARSLRERYESAWRHGEAPVEVEENERGKWVRLRDRSFFQPKVLELDDEALNRKSILLLFGVGVPPFLFHVLRQMPSDTLGLVVLEENLDLLLYTLSLTSVFQAVPPGCRLSFVVSKDRDLLEEALNVNIRPLGIFVVRDPAVLAHPGEREVFTESFKELVTSFRESLRLAVEYLGNTAEDTLLGVRNMCLNAPWIWQSPPLRAFAEAYEGCPAVWVASGPSLDKNIHQLKGMGDRCLILCADSAARKLLRAGIVPHFVISLERPWETYWELIQPVVEEFPDQCRDMILVAQAVLPPQAVGRWLGPVLVLGKAELELDRWVAHTALLAEMVFSGASVAHMALALAAAFQVGSLALVGQDLAYGADSRTHASDTVTKETLELEASRGEAQVFTVPGILGGEVKTHFYWYMFLKIFEQVLPRFPVKVFDCTEGGALIQGTTVEPLSAYLTNHVEMNPTLAVLPPDLARKNCDLERMRSKVVAAKEGIRQRLSELTGLQEKLDHLQGLVDAVGEPGVSAPLRRARSLEAARSLNEYHGMNSSLSFIGQSYAFHSGVALAHSRRLETPSEVQEWRQAYGEMIEAHRRCIAMVRKFLGNVELAAGVYGSEPGTGELPKVFYGLDPLSDQDAQDLAREVFAYLGEHEDEEVLGLEVLLQNLVARCDPYLHRWDGELQWKLGLFLEMQGRGKMAGILMRGAAAAFEGRELPIPMMVAFFKDFARILARDDLVYLPATLQALAVLGNAEAYAPEDPEIPEIRARILATRSAYLHNLSESGMMAGREVRPWERLRLEADIALAEQKLDVALVKVWKLVQLVDASSRVTLTPFMGWLLKTMNDCFDAQAEEVRKAIGTILDEMVEQYVLVMRFPVSWPTRLLEELRIRGLKVEAPEADTLVNPA